MIAAIAIGALSASAAEPIVVRNRVSTGLVYEYAQTSWDSALELTVAEWLRAELVDHDAWSLEARASARFGISLFDFEYLDRTRVRELGLHLHAGTWEVDAGRFVPEGASFRLVDGVQSTAELLPGLRVGGWAGFGADPYTTAPALRFGGGPIATYTHRRGELSFFGEVLATPDGLDRLSAVLRGRLELGRVAEVAGYLDVESGGSAQPFHLADATVLARLDPIEDLRLDLSYDAWSSVTYRVSEDRDPALTRFAAQSAALSGDTWIPQDTLDPSVHHMISARGRWRPVVSELGTRLLVAADARYRYHPLAEHRYAHVGLDAGAIGLLGGRLDAGAGQAFYDWGGVLGTESSLWLWAELDPQGRLAVDATADLFLEPLQGGPRWSPTLYADLFLDWMAPVDGLTVSLGYSFLNSQDLDRWDTWHGVLARVGWSFDSRRSRRDR